MHAMKADMSSEIVPGTSWVRSWVGRRIGLGILKTCLYWDSNFVSSGP